LEEAANDQQSTAARFVKRLKKGVIYEEWDTELQRGIEARRCGGRIGLPTD
jgi:hypothetical protein